MSTTIYTSNGKILINGSNNKWLKAPDPFNPLGLPPNTVRAKFISGYTPTMGDTQTLVDSENNIWDIYRESNVWYTLFGNMYQSKTYNLLEILGANTSNVTTFESFCGKCAALTSIPLFDTSSATDAFGMFSDCSAITSPIPKFNFPNTITNVGYIFQGCTNVPSGALELYQSLSAITGINNTYSAFKNCGSNTVTGAAELAQIPSSWGGTAS